MRNIVLDGRSMGTKEVAHLYLKWVLKASEYHGKNLDALWDVLSTYDRPISISLINKEYLIADLGDYGESLLQVFIDGEKENENIILDKESFK